MKAEKALNLPRTARARTIANTRRAIAEFVESNVPRFNGWLEQVADGIPKRDADGRKILDNQGSVVYLVKPDPATALKLVGDLTEYHLPKLTRADVTVVQRAEIPIEQMSTDDLKRYVMEHLGHSTQEVIDIEPERERTFAERQEAKPDWLK